MAGELVRRSGGLKAQGGGALKKAAKKIAGKKAAGKKVAAKKIAGKKGAKGSSSVKKSVSVGLDGAFHHLQRANAVISLVEGESGGHLRMLLEEGVRRYREGDAGARGILRAAEHLGMAGLYAARASHRLDVEEPDGDGVGKMLDSVGVRVDGLREGGEGGFAGYLPELARELVARAEASDHDLHLAWELGMAAEGICDGVEAGE